MNACDRVKDEKQQLDDRIEELINFIEASNQADVFGTLSTHEQTLLRVQLKIMELLSTLLGERIAHWRE